MLNPHVTRQPHTVARTGPASISSHTHMMPGVGAGPASPSPAQIFAQNHWNQWWNAPLGYTFGQSGEQGTDYGVPLNTGIHAIAPGTVVYSGYSGDASLGYIIQVKSPQGGVWHYQHMNSSLVRPGQIINVGSLLGNSGGPPGQYSTGPHIEVRYSSTFNAGMATGTGISGSYWNDGKWQDPRATIAATVNGVAPPPTSGGASSAGGGIASSISGVIAGLLGFQPTSTAQTPSSASFQFATVQLAPSADVTAFLVAIDAGLELVNPFDVRDAQQDSIAGATFTDPISWIAGFGFNVIEDLTALIWRSLLIIGGSYLLFKASAHFIDYDKVASGAAELAKVGIALA